MQIFNRENNRTAPKNLRSWWGPRAPSVDAQPVQSRPVLFFRLKAPCCTYGIISAAGGREPAPSLFQPREPS